MPDLKAISEEIEGQLGRTGVLGVLDQLEDKMGALTVELPEQVQDGGVPAVTRYILVTDLA